MWNMELVPLLEACLGHSWDGTLQYSRMAMLTFQITMSHNHLKSLWEDERS